MQERQRLIGTENPDSRGKKKMKNLKTFLRGVVRSAVGAPPAAPEENDGPQGLVAPAPMSGLSFRQLRPKRTPPRRVVRMISVFCRNQTELRALLREEFQLRLAVHSGYSVVWLNQHWRTSDPRLRKGWLRIAKDLAFWRIRLRENPPDESAIGDIAYVLLRLPIFPVLYLVSLSISAVHAIKKARARKDLK